ncbi:hypothetical protein C8J57DRAFT_1466450 [Mycena rebaudengoi]|nr:hypothetical protein C8J57DRAFT_1466450 [Mycena rebaudengoi]
MARYMSIISLIANGNMLAGMAVQVLLFIRLKPSGSYITERWSIKMYDAMEWFFARTRWVGLELAKVFKSGAASTLPLAVVLIAIQHLILSTQNLDLPDDASSTDYSSHPLSIPGLSDRKGRVQRSYASDLSHSQQDVEIQQTAHAVTETSRKTQYESSENISSSISRGATLSGVDLRITEQ